MNERRLDRTVAGLLIAVLIGVALVTACWARPVCPSGDSLCEPVTLGDTD